MTLSDIYKNLFCGDPLTVACGLTEYNNLRTGLIRKFRTSSEQLEKIGDTSMQDQYVSCSYDSASHSATFQIKFQTDKKRKPLSYKLL